MVPALTKMEMSMFVTGILRKYVFFHLILRKIVFCYQGVIFVVVLFTLYTVVTPMSIGVGRVRGGGGGGAGGPGPPPIF